MDHERKMAALGELWLNQGDSGWNKRRISPMYSICVVQPGPGQVEVWLLGRLLLSKEGCLHAQVSQQAK